MLVQGESDFPNRLGSSFLILIIRNRVEAPFQTQGGWDRRIMLIVVEGNISAGKSTLCRALADELGYELFLEPMITNPYIEVSELPQG